MPRVVDLLDSSGESRVQSPEDEFMKNATGDSPLGAFGHLKASGFLPRDVVSLSGFSLIQYNRYSSSTFCESQICHTGKLNNDKFSDFSSVPLRSLIADSLGGLLVNTSRALGITRPDALPRTCSSLMFC